MPRLLTLFAFTLIGCALPGLNRQSATINDINMSLPDIRASIGVILPTGQRAISPNGREMLSKHFIIDPRGGYKPAGEAIERWYAQFLVLGDRRPYNIEIIVTREKRILKGDEFIYANTGYDGRLAKELERKLRQELTKRREDRNIIDDFRVF